MNNSQNEASWIFAFMHIQKEGNMGCLKKHPPVWVSLLSRYLLCRNPMLGKSGSVFTPAHIQRHLRNKEYFKETLFPSSTLTPLSWIYEKRFSMSISIANLGLYVNQEHTTSLMVILLPIDWISVFVSTILNRSRLIVYILYTVGETRLFEDHVNSLNILYHYSLLVVWYDSCWNMFSSEWIFRLSRLEWSYALWQK